MVGIPGANIVESEMTTAEAARRSAFRSTNGSRFALPISSSPSARMMRLTGSWPFVFRCASAALTWR